MDNFFEQETPNIPKADLIKISRIWNQCFSILKLKTTKRGINLSEVRDDVEEYLKKELEWTRKDIANFLSFCLLDLYLKYNMQPPQLPDHLH